MKNMSLLFLLISSSISTAQSFSKSAIGLRVGGGNGFGSEVSYQRTLGDTNRLEIDLGAESGDNFSAFKLTGIYQWIWELEGDFNWYAGAGAGLGNVNYDNGFPGLRDRDRSETFLYTAGQIGIEYNFDIPLQLSLDTRPELTFAKYGDNLRLAVALGIRYQF